MQEGLTNRRTGNTSMNERSSRSHSIFTIIVDSESQEMGNVACKKRARLHLVDLAGSERQKDTECKGQALLEAGCINKS